MTTYDHYHYPLYSPEQLDEARDDMRKEYDNYQVAFAAKGEDGVRTASDEHKRHESLRRLMLEANYKAVNGGNLQEVFDEYDVKIHAARFRPLNR